MKTEILHKKLERYLNGESQPAEVRQIQTWLSVPHEEEKQLTAEEKEELGNDILAEIKEATAYPLFYPREGKQWWQKAVAAFF